MQQLEENYAEGRALTAIPNTIVVIGASTGGPMALAQILPRLPRTLDAAIVVIQHMRPGFSGLVARQLHPACQMTVQESSNFQLLARGSVVFAPGNGTVAIERPGTLPDRPYVLRVNDSFNSAERARRPIDEAMVSAAQLVGNRAVGVLLTGIGDDGRAGMIEIKKHGGHTIAQDEESSIVYDMPESAIAVGVVDEVVPLWNISDRIVGLVGEI